MDTMNNHSPQSNLHLRNFSSLSDNNSLTFSAKNVISYNLIGSLNNDIPGWLFSLLMEVTSYAMIVVAVFGLNRWSEIQTRKGASKKDADEDKKEVSTKMQNTLVTR
ncbi:hypothetical protein RRG08_053410 [Elysia crispata]|uniref:Uncharacterized protein n=1 Tax=Elysia crispata TaxID=231223 RepID=A0AAE1DGA8_9GAST|nr:hypothetical protein RRG08_053410 [Elysia crispata]